MLPSKWQDGFAFRHLSPPTPSGALGIAPSQMRLQKGPAVYWTRVEVAKMPEILSLNLYLEVGPQEGQRT